MNENESRRWQEVEKRAASLIDKGQLLQSLGQNEEALACFEVAVAITRGARDRSDSVALMLPQALDNKGSALMDLDRLTEALICYDEAIQVHRGIVGHDGTWNDTREIALSIMNKGLALMRLGRHEEATEDLARVFLNLGEVFVRRDALNLAGTCLRDSIYHWQLAAWEAATGQPADTHSTQLLECVDWDTASDAVIEEQSDAFKADYAYTLYAWADVEQREGKYQQAVDHVDSAIAYQRAIIGHVPCPKVREDLIESVKLRGRILANQTTPKRR